MRDRPQVSAIRQGSKASKSSTVLALGNATSNALRYRYPSMPLTRQVCSSEYRLALALALAPACVSANSQLRHPMTNGRIAFSQSLLSIGYLPSWT